MNTTTESAMSHSYTCPHGGREKNCVDVVIVPLREYKRRALTDGSGVDWEMMVKKKAMLP